MEGLPPPTLDYECRPRRPLPPGPPGWGDWWLRVVLAFYFAINLFTWAQGGLRVVPEISVGVILLAIPITVVVAVTRGLTGPGVFSPIAFRLFLAAMAALCVFNAGACCLSMPSWSR